MPPDTATPAPPLMHTAEKLERRMILGIIAVTLALLVLTTGVISQVALSALEQEVMPEVGREVAAMGNNLAAQIEHAVELGIPVQELVGVEAYFQATLDDQPPLNSIRLVTPDGERKVQRPGRLRQARDVAIPVQTDSGPIGVLHLGVNPSALDQAANASKWDIAVVLLVSLLTAAELLAFVTDRFVRTPMRLVQRLATHVEAEDWTFRSQPTGLDAAGRLLAQMNALVQRMNARRRHIAWLAAEVMREAPTAGAAVAGVLGRLDAVRFADSELRTQPAPRSPSIARLPLFLYMFAEQLSTSFIPIFADTVYHSGGLVPEALAVGLPISVFAALIALASPFGAGLTDRLGARTVLALGCIPAVIGYLMVAQAYSVQVFALGRVVTAVGYALITISCRSYLAAAAEDAAGGRHGRSMSVFVYAAMTGALCGTAIGAVLADRIGYRGTFYVSAALTICAGLLALRTMDPTAARRPLPGKATPRPDGELRTALRNPRILALLLFAAIPANFVLSGFVFYIAPLLLHGLGDSQPEIGRQVMLYALTMLLTMHLGAWTAGRMKPGRGSIALAGLATGFGLLLILVAPAAVAVPAAIVVIGLSHGLASAPMLAVVPELCPGLAQRIGSILGPVVAASLAALFGFTTAIGVIGTMSLVAAAGYWATTTWKRA
jgi:MFS family permease